MGLTDRPCLNPSFEIALNTSTCSAIQVDEGHQSPVWGGKAQAQYSGRLEIHMFVSRTLGLSIVAVPLQMLNVDWLVCCLGPLSPMPWMSV